MISFGNAGQRCAGFALPACCNNHDFVARKLGLSALPRPEREAGTTLVLVTHDMHVASAAQRVVTMRDGLIISDEPVTEQYLTVD